MFINRFIKTLKIDTKALASGKVTPGPVGPFLYPSVGPDPFLYIEGKKISAGEFFYEALETEYFPEINQGCQFFDFGDLSNDEIKEECGAVAEGYNAGLIDIPAPICWMEHSWTDDYGFPLKSGYLFVKTENGLTGAEIRLMDRNYMLNHTKNPIAPNLKDKVAYKEYFVWDGILMRLEKSISSKGYDHQVIFNTSKEKVNPCNIFDPLMAMLGRLNADGIDKVERPAPAKLNRHRAANGLAAAVGHTEVIIRPHGPDFGHTKASGEQRGPKRYHFRRGHVRHFQTGEKTWVRPCFVGNPLNGIIKHTYKVDHKSR